MNKYTCIAINPRQFAYNIILLFSFAALCIFSSCGDNDEQTEPTESFIFVSHLRSSNAAIEVCDSIASLIPYNNYQLVMIGGDVTPATSESLSTLYYVDSIFNIQSEHTIWALGNHDYSSVPNVSSVTHRPAYYSYYYLGITFLVLDTQDSLSHMVGQQLQLIKNVTDTISESKHLIVLHHKLIWMWGNSNMEPVIDSVANGVAGTCFYCTNPNNFYQDVYPLLLNAKNRGIEVMCLAGDVGFHVKEYNYTTTDGIVFRACGMNSGDPGNLAIVFSYSPITRLLTSSSKLTTSLIPH